MVNLKQWLLQICPFSIDSLQEIPGDASFRRYFRLYSGRQSYMVMDASNQRDSFEPYVAIDKALYTLGVAVPEIMAFDRVQGYMLISDLGDNLYLNALKPENSDDLYKKALDTLAIIQACPEVQDWPLPAFDQSFMQQELHEFNNWFLEGYLKLTPSAADKKLLQTTFSQLTAAAHQQTQVFIHRDYHSANLMLLPNQQVGVLDFQDACIGPITYDAVSLLRDSYISWPEEKVQHWVAYYYAKLQERHILTGVSLNEFSQWFDWMGMQRHMKAIFIFARKYLRDGTPRYLEHIPRTLQYVVTISERYPEFQAFHAYIRDRLLPVFYAATEGVA